MNFLKTLAICCSLHLLFVFDGSAQFSTQLTTSSLNFRDGSASPAFLNYNGLDLFVSNTNEFGWLLLNGQENVRFQIGGATQMVLNNSGNLGIGEFAPSSRLHVQQAGSFSNNGITLEDDDGSIWNTYVDGADDYNFAFEGDLTAFILDGTGEYVESSDESLKSNIAGLSPVLDRVLQLKPSQFTFNRDSLNRLAVGFIAQETEALFPNVVVEKDGIKGISYNKFGVIAIKAIQELKVELEESITNNTQMQNEMDALKAEVAELKALLQTAVEHRSVQLDDTNALRKQATLAQNAPNPFQGITSIPYFIPEGTTQSSLRITDTNGSIIKEITIQHTGAGQLEIDANTLSNGNYFYTLVVDGQIIATKQMILTK
ncbi:MAG: tail fiber domain-containing protein [Bacteroidota bacterium]